MTRVLRGVIHGRTIELDTETGLEDGRAVEVVLRAKELPGPPQAGSSGALKPPPG